MKRGLFMICALILTVAVQAQNPISRTEIYKGKFEQLGTILPTPNAYRTASGAPGVDYWQQKADYKIKVELSEEKQTITGSETITYYNNSPDVLTYLWLQLDQNMRSLESNTPKVSTSRMRDEVAAKSLEGQLGRYDFDGGFKITGVKSAEGTDLDYIINQTMMRIDLPTTLKPGANVSFSIDWWYNVNDRNKIGGRSGYEYFPEDDNYLFTIAQWFPRMAVYDDKEGWQNKQFLGSGEFALVFGDYDVEITVPADHVVASTGELLNAEEVLTAGQLKKFNKAKESEDLVIIVTQKEAEKKEKTKADGTKTWKFHADDVRDFAFASSRKFIWDAKMVPLENGQKPLAMSFYPKEGNPLWEEESTKAVANTLITFSRMTVDYPYPVAISVHTASIGMEYPMICFNYGRPDEDGTYTDRTKWGMIGVIVHEVGHNFFPMIINSDERQWTWMDEGLDTYIQALTQREHYPDMPARRGTAKSIVNYMKGNPDFIRPIMTNSEQVTQLGSNAYAKPAAALDILRETVMGPELFDKAFKEYSERWAFKHPAPADFFRTMEDASAMDLDWFWRGWFYTTDYVDIDLTNVKWYKAAKDQASFEGRTKEGKIKNQNVDENGNNIDFTAGPQEFLIKDTDNRYYREFKNRVDDGQIKKKYAEKNFYELTLTNKGGLVMPVIVEWTYKDGTKEIERIPAEIWRRNEIQVTKVFVKEKEVTNIVIDPNMETADVEVENNVFPKKPVDSNFEKFKSKGEE